MLNSSPKLWVAAYLAPLPSQRQRPTNPTGSIDAFYAATQAGGFPHDIGDDPAFFSASYFEGPITWGVCRHDVRSAIRPGDWMVFFSAQRDCEDSGMTRYRFVAALCVETKLAQTGLFNASSPYSEYLNLLVRPKDSGWEHYEPSLAAWHEDWLWRICDQAALGKRSLLKRDIVEAGRRHLPGQPLAIRGQPAPVGDNYVVFSSSSALVMSNPPLVATHRKGEPRETWEADLRSTRIRAVLFGSSSRGLRTANGQQPHRHFSRHLEDASLPVLLQGALISTSKQSTTEDMK